MPRFHLTQAAKADLKDIGRYTQQKWGRAQRDKYLTMNAVEIVRILHDRMEVGRHLSDS